MRLRVMLSTAVVMTMLFSAQAFAAPVLVACGRGQHALVRNAFVRGESLTRVECVSDGRRLIGYDDRYLTGYRASRPHRSWGKSALIIGGSAGTGAGLGGLVGGRKGALVGAALGGGVASLYEGAHRR
jgi:hypothetical protein